MTERRLYLTQYKEGEGTLDDGRPMPKGYCRLVLHDGQDPDKSTEIARGLVNVRDRQINFTVLHEEWRAEVEEYFMKFLRYKVGEPVEPTPEERAILLGE